MKELKKNIRGILGKPSTDHLVLSPVQKDIHFIRFSNNGVNRENLFDRKVETAIEAGVNGRTALLTIDGQESSSVEAAAAKARQTAELLPEDPEYMPPVTKEETAGIKTVSIVYDPIPVEEKYTLLSHIFAAMKNAGLVSAGSLASSVTEHAVFNTKGVNLSHYSLDYALNVTAMSGKSAFKDFYYGSDLKKLDLENFINNLTEKAKLASKVKTQDAGKYAVILGPDATAELLAFFYYYAFDRKKIDEGLSSLASRMDKEIAVKDFHFFSDPYDPDMKVNPPFDAKTGMPCRRVELIKEGHFQEAFCTRYYAKKNGFVPCGNGIMNTKYNLSVEGKNKTLEQMAADIGNGLFINSFFYIRVVDEMDSVFTGMTRNGVFRIKNGKLINAVNNFRFNQNVFEMLANIIDIGEARNTEFGRFPYLAVKDFNLVSQTEF
ncbi:MAG: hypothetical protein K5838_04935 [Elusimicrobiales bacterium]|nr:hypothetical protein [Elusimicrobiales bacterium]